MKFSHSFSFLAVAAVLTLPVCAQKAVLANAGSTPAVPRYLITNDDEVPKTPTSSTIFNVIPGGVPENALRVSLGGVGGGGGYFAANRVSVLHSTTDACAYLSLAASGEVSAIDLRSKEAVGNFAAASGDSGLKNGIGLVNNGAYLWASFSSSNTIGTYSVLSGCGLQFLGDISPQGKHGGNVKGMAVHGDTLVVAYGEGSVESFNISAGIPVSNGDLQNATGYATDRFPTAVDISPDGRFAIFGDMAPNTTIEVSEISSGKLTKTVLYNLGIANDASNVVFSPDGTLIYIANTGTGQLTAAFFDRATGVVTHGCVSARLRGFDDTWVFLASPVPELPTGTGSVIYLAEFGSPSSIAMVNVKSSGGQCMLKEAEASPIVAPNSNVLLSIGVYPPRPY